MRLRRRPERHTARGPWLAEDQWRKIRAKFDRLGATYYGKCVFEPHHDGTPHGPLLRFMAPKDRATVQIILQDDALDGATATARIKHACKIEGIDRSAGSVAGYVVKYIAKVLGSHGLDAAAKLADSELIDLMVDPKHARVARACLGLRLGGSAVSEFRAILDRVMARTATA